MRNSSTWPIDRSLSDDPDESGPGSGDNEGVLQIPQSSSITGALPSGFLVSYSGHTLGESYSSAEMQPVYPTAPADHQIVLCHIQDTRWGDLLLCRDAVGVFNSPSRQGHSYQE